MLKYQLLQTPHNTKMLAIILDEINPNESIDKEAILKAVRMLYKDDSAEIKSIELNELTPHLDLSACKDYKIQVTSKGKTYTCYNLGCCFLDLKDLKTLYKDDSAEHESLRLLREDRYYTHPLYYEDYARDIRNKVKAILNIKDK